MRITINSLIPLALLTVASCDALNDSGKEDPDNDSAGVKVFDASFVHTVELFLSEVDWLAIINEAEAYENTNPVRPYYNWKSR